MRTALVYDRVNKWGGAERVLLALHEIFPDAPLYTAVYDAENAQWAKVFPRVVPSFLQKIPFAKKNHEYLGFLTPFAFESFHFDEYDLVISVTSEAAKGVLTKPGTKHICYCLTPTRYLWSGYDEYRNNTPSKLAWIPFYKVVSRPFLSFVKMWDKVASQRPDLYIAISTAVKKRIKKYYGRNSVVVYPPVNLESFKKEGKVKEKGDYYLYVSRLIPYKKPELAIKAFNILGKKLVVVGKGSEKNRLKKIAGRNIKFIDYLTDEKLAEYYKKAKALIFPGEEDFGIVMVESIASGTPVVAYAKGGALDIVKDRINGVLFSKQDAKTIIEAVNKVETLNFRRKDLLRTVEKFSKENFLENFTKNLNP
jgi:glycosyltransferase involved in cell wall biosynthesis